MLLGASASALGTETTSFAYDALGRIAGSVADSGSTNKTTTIYRYDAANNRRFVNVAKQDGTRVPIFRFYNGSKHFYTMTYLEGQGAGFGSEGIPFASLPGGGTGTQPLYRCYNAANADHFISVSSTCEGVTYEGQMGWAYTASGTGRKPLYRFYSATLKDHLFTTSYDEGTAAGYAYESLLGYVL
ncbi:hypothetical protein [Sphingobium sp. YR768]|uniref:hypothetical protein n=1 Tax=Sphingobium sp. YR768 TaxID=1884365 RepID=UPI000B89D635|nr:hypothetical protein [Sphingobium sp. YR768]